VKLFPHALIRVAGGHFDELAALECPRIVEAMGKLSALDARIGELRVQVSEAMHAAVPDQSDDNVVRKLVNLRRDIFNGRRVSAEKRGWIRERIEDGGLMDALTEAETARKSLAAEGEGLFAKEIAASRRKLQKLSQSDVLRKGLVLSSQVLLKAADQYAAKDPKSFKKRELKTELSLIKYLTRIHAKTSPFSTFTSLAMAELANIESDGLVAVDGKPAPVGHIRLNNQLFKYLFDLFKSYPPYAERIPVRPNPTIYKEAECFLFLTNSNNVESFQRIPLNPVLDLFLDLAGADPNGVPVAALAAKALEAVDAELDAIKGYIGQLLEYGFLEYNIGISGIDPDWDEKLVVLLESWRKEGLPFAAELIETLVDLRAKSRQYAESDADQRIRLLEEAHERFKQVCLAIHEAAGLPESERMTPQELREQQEREKAEKEAAEDEDGGDADDEEEADEAEEIFKHISFTAFRITPEQMFYEDVALSGEFRLDRDAVAVIAETADKLYRELSLYLSKEDSLAEMKQYFREKFEGEVDLLTFYEAFYRDHKKPLAELNKKREEAERKRREAQKEAEAKASEEEPDAEAGEGEAAAAAGDNADKPAEDPEMARFKIAAVEARRELRNAWGKNLAERQLGEAATEGERVDFDIDMLRAVNKEVENPGFPRPQERSFALFLQFYQEPDEEGRIKTRATVSANPFGYGRFFSRFLHIYPDATETVREWNRRSEDDALLLEDCDASIFNANLHPPLMPGEVWMPGGQNSLPPERQTPITEIKLRFDPETDELTLRHKESGRPIHVFDLGFQGPRGRSELFRMLGLFNPGMYVSWEALTGAANDRRRSQDGPYSLPRIVVEDSLTLQRRQWVFPKDDTPLRKSSDNDWRYFQRVWRWKEKHGLPDDVFVYVTRGRQLENVDPELRKKVGRDDYKPQYISFKSPLLVRLFEKLADKAPTALTVAEMLPAPRHLQKIGGAPCVTELIIQWQTSV